MELAEWREKAFDTIKGELTVQFFSNNRNNGDKNGSNHGNRYGDSTEVKSVIQTNW